MTRCGLALNFGFHTFSESIYLHTVLGETRDLVRRNRPKVVLDLKLNLKNN